jgi:hypothetical protein
MQLCSSCTVAHYSKLLHASTALLSDIATVDKTTVRFDQASVLERLVDLIGHLLQQASPIEPIRSSGEEERYSTTSTSTTAAASTSSTTTSSSTTSTTNTLSKQLASSIDLVAISAIATQTIMLLDSGFATEVAPYVLAIICGVSQHYPLGAQQQILSLVAPCFLSKYANHINDIANLM